jgi:hypothetical protein
MKPGKRPLPTRERSVAIKILDDPDITLTASEHARWLDLYRQAFMHFTGTPPTFNAWVAKQLNSHNAKGK